MPARAVSREGLGQAVGTSSEHPVGRWSRRPRPTDTQTPGHCWVPSRVSPGSSREAEHNQVGEKPEEGKSDRVGQPWICGPQGRESPAKATGSGEDSPGCGRSAEQNVGQDVQTGKSFPEGTLSMASGLGLRLCPPAGAALPVIAEEVQACALSPHPTQKPKGRAQCLGSLARRPGWVEGQTLSDCDREAP